MKHKIVFVIFLIISGCASNSISRVPGVALLIGEDSSTLKVMIRTIDDGEILWVGNYQLGTKSPVKPGQHTVNVMCQFNYSWGTKLVPGNINLNAQPDTDYKITGRISNDGKKCDLSFSI